MSYHYVLHEKAQQEYEEAIEWYIARSIKAAENLILRVEYTLKQICDNPVRWRNEYKNYRELGVKKYPYVIIYTVEEDKQRVVVTAFFHASRNPKKKYLKKQ
jgi:plasmid stabilization system protein ParE